MKIRGLLLGAAVALAACRGGTLGENPAQPPGRIDGLLFGTVTRGGTSHQAFAFVNGGRFMAADDGGVFYDGTYAMSGASASGSGLHVYATDPGLADTGLDAIVRQVTDAGATLSATVSTTGWQGSIASTVGTITLALDYQSTLDTQDSSLTFIDNGWLFTSGTHQSSLTIASDGATTNANSDNGTATNCDGAGQASIIDANYGSYGWSETLSGAGCATNLAASYTGFGVLSESTNPLDTLTVFLANANYFFSYRSYQRQ